MRYFKAYETDNRPYTLFDLVADNLEELQDLGLEGNPLIVTEDQLVNPADPDYISFEYGICSKRIFNGEIEDRPIGEITEQQEKLAAATEVVKTVSVEEKISAGTFDFDGKKFPMGLGATQVYRAIFQLDPANRVIVSTTGNYTLKVADIDAFKAAYLGKILAIQTETIEEIPV